MFNDMVKVDFLRGLYLDKNLIERAKGQRRDPCSQSEMNQWEDSYGRAQAVSGQPAEAKS